MKKTIATLAVAAITFGSINAFSMPVQTQQDTSKTKTHKEKKMKHKKPWKDTTKKDTMKM
ncbi:MULTISPECIES: hypothetical protein [unclassified Mucilaginibacter]|uniref:hypothetical protein n=1 Tax=unclassified Mucilaginibacter TaxID=2617802 RepID=UPI00095BB01B|nr:MULTISPECIES: hypothetical protein [unclassified Mucilaginibacter]OJW17190.1 MAG: hypothetical protein BGO48_06445 [Mucilaginibacter sp. 44-25]PLW89280.1 MAG: hypothetical protein C0154_12430 [Mucilaginibacter sp.]HEK19212.1 hypothetical protein [Bacteroidota bacterium]